MLEIVESNLGLSPYHWRLQYIYDYYIDIFPGKVNYQRLFLTLETSGIDNAVLLLHANYIQILYK